MPGYAYTIRDAGGRTRQGILEASDAPSASASLRRDGNLLLKLEVSDQATRVRNNSERPRFVIRRPRSANIEVALKQMSVMLPSGLTLLESLREVANQTTSTSLRLAWMDIAEQVQAGRSLTEAMSSYRWLGRMVIQLVEVGEKTGSLDIVLSRAADALEKRRLLTSQVISALLYPSIVFFCALGVTIFILAYAVPKITVYLKAMGKPLPPMTQILVDASNFLLAQWPLIIGGMTVATLCIAVCYLSTPGRLLLDTLLMRFPLLGYILRTSATAGFSQSMALLLSSGVSIIESLRTCQDLHRNRKLAKLIAEGRQAVIEGNTLAPSFSTPGTFMPMLTSMIAIGERSGNLDHTLVSCATFHEQRLAALIRTLSSVVEIIVVLLVGGIVGYVYIAFMLALYGAAL